MKIITRLRLPSAVALTALPLAVLAGCSSSSSGGGSANGARADASETFRHVTPAANRYVQRSLALMRGVASDTYQNGTLTVAFKPTATKLDQHNVENVVRSGQAQASATPSPTPTPHSRPTK